MNLKTIKIYKTTEGLPYHHPNPEEKFAATAHLSKKKKEKVARKRKKIL